MVSSDFPNIGPIHGFISSVQSSMFKSGSIPMTSHKIPMKPNETVWLPSQFPWIPMKSQAILCDTSRPSLVLAVCCARCSWLLWGPWGTRPPGTLGPWDLGTSDLWCGERWWFCLFNDMGMDQYLWIPFLVGWTSIYQLFWGSPGVQGFDPSPYEWSISPISIQKWMVHDGTSISIIS